MSDLKIPYDLQDLYDAMLLEAADNGGEFSSDEEFQFNLIERIAALEAENKALKAENERLKAPVTQDSIRDLKSAFHHGYGVLGLNKWLIARAAAPETKP